MLTVTSTGAAIATASTIDPRIISILDDVLEPFLLSFIGNAIHIYRISMNKQFLLSPFSMMYRNESFEIYRKKCQDGKRKKKCVRNQQKFFMQFLFIINM